MSLQKKTVDRLLKKQDSKLAKYGKIKLTKKDIPMMTYSNNNDEFSISVPQGFEFPYIAQTKRYLYNFTVSKVLFSKLSLFQHYKLKIT